MISVRDISVVLDGKFILKNVSFDMIDGHVYALMGPNGSGKSTLAQVIAGNPEYPCDGGSVAIDGENFLDISPDERARRGLFVAFQQSPAIPGLSIFNFLKEAVYARSKEHGDLAAFEQHVMEHMDFLGLNRSFLYRNLHDGFSGGEKKRFELLQMLVLKPLWIVLDEIDSGLDVDALKLVAQTVDRLKKENPRLIVLCITHYQRMAYYLNPSQVYVLCNGELVASGDSSLIEHIQANGYHLYGS
jgi:Fe-S cluster assembly ATP-binding protein